MAMLCLVTQSCPTLCLPGFSVHGDSSGEISGVGCHAHLQGIFSTQGSNPVSLMFSTLAGRFFTTGATWEASKVKRSQLKSCRCMAKTTTI